jgi:arylsulfatase A-like enzyme
MARTQDALTRRRFVQGTAAGSLALAGFARAGQAQVAKPNVVFILADDLGYADVSCYGQRDYTTPNIDRIANEGMRFMQAYSNSANCSPTRTALATGRYQMRLEVGLEEPIGASTPKSVGLPPSHPTLPSLLKKAGYGTSLVGKWHLGFLPDFSPLKSGYDKFFGIYSGAADYFNHGADAKRSGAEAGQLHEGEVPVERHGYMTNLLGDRAVETIDGYAKTKEPFLLSLHFTAPHWPWEGPDDEEESKRIRNIFHRDGGTQKTYMKMMQSLDSNIGRVLQALDVNGLSSNTIVVFTSDNGGERFSKIWPFTGMKGELLDPTCHRRNADGPGLPGGRRQSAAGAHRARGAACAQAVLAFQVGRAARRARRRPEISADCGQRIPVRRGQGPARAGPAQGPPQGRVRPAQVRLGGLERHDAAGAPATRAL